jgi:histidine transport system permease protein
VSGGFLGGYGPLILAGTWVTIQLALLSLVVAVVLGLLGAWAKLSESRLLRGVATAYTTLIRGVPDLVLMLLIFFSMQIYLNDVTDLLGLAAIDIDPFAAGVLTLGFIYGAYFAETFRGAFMAVPHGQLEAATAYGMREFQVFRRILFPQMMRHALPGIGNNWQVLLKSTALVSLIGLSDLVKVAQDAGNVTFRVFLFISLTGLIYLALTTVSNAILYWLDRRYTVGVREVSL